MTNRFIADWHDGHDNILRFDKRPFKNVEEQRKVLIKNWNKEVQNPNDVTYILGDMFWLTPEVSLPILKQLRGRKVLIEGNHDRFVNDKSLAAKEMRDCFDEITHFKIIKENKKKIIMCHYPIMQFDGHFGDKAIHLYGHVHQTFEYDQVKRWKEECRVNNAPHLMFNVGAMMPYMDYTPRSLDFILEHGEDVFPKEQLLTIN